LDCRVGDVLDPDVAGLVHDGCTHGGISRVVLAAQSRRVPAR
jgi:hypothetical protein